MRDVLSRANPRQHLRRGAQEPEGAGGLIERRGALRKLIEPDPRLLIQFSRPCRLRRRQVLEAAADLGLEGIVSKRAASQYRGGPSRSWLKTKDMVEGEFILLGTERDRMAYPGRWWHQIGMAALRLPARLS